MKNLLILPDGKEISSGSEGSAIRQFSLTQTVNNGRELTLGSACAALLEVTLQLPPEVVLKVEDPLVLYRVTDADVRDPVGIFRIAQIQHRGAQQCKITAYDRMTLFDRELSLWLASLDGWPYTLHQLAALVCQQCGVELETEELPNGALPVQMFTMQNVTGRQLLEWIGEISGRFCRINARGALEFGWYTPAQRTLGPTPEPGITDSWDAEELSLELQQAPEWEQDGLTILDATAVAETGDLVRLMGEDGLYYYPDGLSLSDYTVAPVDLVQLWKNSEEICAYWPQSGEGTNVYRISDNPFLAVLSQQSLTEIAQMLYAQLSQVRYTPCRVLLPADRYLEPGKIVSVTHRSGRVAQVYLMSAVQTGNHRTLEATGSANRGGTPILRTFRDLNGKVMHLGLDVDGLKAENRDAKGNLAAMKLDLEGIRTRVDSTQENQARMATEISQTARSVSVFVNRMETEGTQQVTTRNGYTFSDQGLQIQRSGESVQSLLTHTGLQVTRDREILLRADKDGVRAVDVTVGNYLVIGSHARLEDYYQNRTACYYI